MSGYRKALRYSEEACQLEPENGDILNTLGVAYYRVGNYEKALEVLSRSDKIYALQYKGSHPDDLAFLAMAHQQLGHAKEAQAGLQLLRERIKDPRLAQDPELKASCAKRKNCWPNPSRPAASKQVLAARGRESGPFRDASGSEPSVGEPSASAFRPRWMDESRAVRSPYLRSRNSPGHCIIRAIGVGFLNGTHCGRQFVSYA